VEVAPKVVRNASASRASCDAIAADVHSSNMIGTHVHSTYVTDAHWASAEVGTTEATNVGSTEAANVGPTKTSGVSCAATRECSRRQSGRRDDDRCDRREYHLARHVRLLMVTGCVTMGDSRCADVRLCMIAAICWALRELCARAKSLRCALRIANSRAGNIRNGLLLAVRHALQPSSQPVEI
jgi:hypothetical protein